MTVICKKDDIGLYYSFRKGVCYNYNDINSSIIDDYGVEYYYNTKRFNEFFCTLNDIRKMKLKKIEKTV